MVDLSQHPNLSKEAVLECNLCGISLVVTNVDGHSVTAEVVDEGK
jgi:hypothetical protein